MSDPIPMAPSQGHKDLEAKGQIYEVGAHLEALFMSVLMAASNSGCIFFRFLTSGLEQCAVVGKKLGYLHKHWLHTPAVGKSLRRLTHLVNC